MATLTVDAVAQMDAARAEVSGLGDAVRGLGSDVDAAANQARGASVDFDSMGEGADNVSSKSSQAAGAMGDLAGGLDAIGATGAATALEGVALGSQVAAGAGDALNLVAETSVGRYIASTAAAVGHRAATIAGSVATGAMTVTQTALNAVMSLNPVALVVISIVALTAGIILAYKHSETFREIVQAVFDAAKGYVTLYVDAIQTVIDIVQSLPGIAKEAWNRVSDAVGNSTDAASGFVTDLYDDVTGGIDNVRDTVAAGLSAAFAPIQTAIDWVQDLIDKISGIHLPDINPLTRAAVLPGTRPDPGPGDTGNTFAPGSVQISLTAAPQDKEKSIADLVDALREYFTRHGQTLSITEVPS